MANLNDPPVRELLEQPNHAVISTYNKDGSIHNTVVWISAEDGTVAVNSALGRKWPTNIERDPRVNVLVYEQGNPYNYVEIRGTASETTEGRGRSHRRADEEVHRAGHVPVPPAR